jgi:hypothetical protein
VFNSDIEVCNRCGGHVKIIACIEEPVVIKKILAYLGSKDTSTAPAHLPPSRGRRRPVCFPDTRTTLAAAILTTRQDRCCVEHSKASKIRAAMCNIC